MRIRQPTLGGEGDAHDATRVGATGATGPAKTPPEEQNYVGFTDIIGRAFAYYAKKEESRKKLCLRVITAKWDVYSKKHRRYCRIKV